MVVQCVEAAGLGSLSSLSIVVSAKVVAVLVIASVAAVVVVAVVVVAIVTVEIVVEPASEKASTIESWARAAARSSDATVVEMVRYFRTGRSDF